MHNYYLENAEITENYIGDRLSSYNIFANEGYILKQTIDEETTYIKGTTVGARQIEYVLPTLEAIPENEAPQVEGEE